MLRQGKNQYTDFLYICRLSNRKSKISKIKRTSVDVLLLKFN